MLLRAKPRCWLWGLFPLLLVGLLVVFGTQDVIEKDLEKRSSVALRDAGIDWANPNFQGLDGTIVGLAPSEAERLKAVEIVEGVWGVRTARDNLSLSPEISPFTWSALHGKGKIFLKGYVPSSKVRQSVVGLVKAKFPNAKVNDELIVARGVPDESQWFGQVSFGLSQLARMRYGELKLIDNKMSLSGAAIDQAGFTGLQDVFKVALPQNLVKDEVGILPPLVEDYFFTARFAPKALLLEGVAPSRSIIDGLERQAGEKFPETSLQNKLILGSGAPAGWGEALSLSLSQLSQLYSGQVSLRGTDVQFEGVARDIKTAKDVRLKVRSAFPKGFRVNDVITVKEPDVPLISPFALSVADDGSSLVVEGSVLSEQQRGVILDALRAKLQERAIVDKLSIARGAGPYFQDAVIAGIGVLPGLVNGRMSLLDQELSLSGETKDKALFDQLKNRPQGLPDDVSWRNAVRLDSTSREKAESLREEKLDQEVVKKTEPEVKSAEELAKKRNWLSPDETQKRLDDLYKESGAVSAKECQLLMNSIVRGSAIRFGVNSSVISSSSYDVLAKVQSVATRCTNTVIRIEGHTDSDGSDAYNLELSKRRARAVIRYLVDKSIPENRLDAKGYGEKQPVASNSSSQGKALNRRIEFVVFEN